MKVTLIASVSANGKVLLANNPNHQIAPEVMEFLVQKAVESGNIIFGYSTYTMFIDAFKMPLQEKKSSCYPTITKPEAVTKPFILLKKR